jgi:hypothetical protein
VVVAIELTEQEKSELLRAASLLFRIRAASNTPLSNLAGIAATKIHDVMQQAADEQPIDPPY